MKLTPATLILRDALGHLLAECAEGGSITERWKADGDFRRKWLDRASDELFAGESGIGKAVDTVRREAFEAGGSPAVSVVLMELQESEPGAYQAGLARAIQLLSQEMAMHYGSIFEAGLRVGREQSAGRVPDQAPVEVEGRNG